MAKIQLYQTCGACPEAYNAYYRGSYVGHFRLRNGSFSVTYYGSKGNECVYNECPKGDGLFEYEEREMHLNAGCEALLEAIRNDAVDNKPEDLYEMISEEP